MGSFSSLSPSSEVSDIRNWFPSYVYESFVLDTCDGFGDSVFKEDVTEEDGRVAEEEIRNGENFGDFTTSRNFDDEKTNPNCKNKYNLKPSAKMPDSVHSPSQLSDSPSIKKWFSDYEYESPISGLNDGFSDTVAKENECEKKQGVVENNREKEPSRLEHRDITNSKHGLGAGKCECKGFLGVSKPEKHLISDSLLSSSLISDPPNVRNWFSNYTYESPVLGTVDGFEDSITSRCVNEKVVIEDRIKENQVLNMNSSFGDFKEEKKLLCEKQDLPPDASFQSLKVDTSLRNMERKSPRKAICGKNFGGSSLPREKVDVDSLTTCGRNDKELEGKHNSENGFVITRKNKPIDENSRPVEILSGCSRNKSIVPLQKKRINSAESDIVSNSVEGRSILAERSNFQHPDVMAVSGKWRCPQKNKPNTGPPMKQLRLERWVNRQ